SRSLRGTRRAAVDHISYDGSKCREHVRRPPTGPHPRRDCCPGIATPGAARARPPGLHRSPMTRPGPPRETVLPREDPPSKAAYGGDVTNRLAHATSPYLLQHVENPVHWQEWGPAAFAEARTRDVPI